MAKTGYTATVAATSGATGVPLAAGVAKTVLGVKSNAAFGVDLRKIAVGFDGITASAVPVLVELVYCTFATNAPGTNSTSRTPAQAYGRVVASGVTAASNWTAEPTVITVLKQYLLTPNGGLVIEEFAPDHGFDCAAGEGFAIRCTAPAIVDVVATMEWERS